MPSLAVLFALGRNEAFTPKVYVLINYQLFFQLMDKLCGQKTDTFARTLFFQTNSSKTQISFSPDEPN